MSDKLSDEQIERAFDSFKCTHPGAAPWYDVPERFLASTVRRLLAASPAPAIPAEPDDEAISAVRARLEQHAVYFSRSSIEEIVSAVRKAAPAISESDLLALLPGTTYMDEPDGGSLSLLEQLQRMAKDAGRYRWLRDENRETPDGTRELMAVQYRLPFSEGTDTELFDTALDAAIDAALAGEKS